MLTFIYPLSSLIDSLNLLAAIGSFILTAKQYSRHELIHFTDEVPCHKHNRGGPNTKVWVPPYLLTQPFTNVECRQCAITMRYTKITQMEGFPFAK